MSEVKVTVKVEVDGVIVDGFPMVRTMEVDQVVGFNPYTLAAQGGGAYAVVPAATIGVLQMLVLRPETAITVRLAAQSDAGIDLGADGLLLLIGANIDDGAATNAKVTSAVQTDIQGLAAGRLV